MNKGSYEADSSSMNVSLTKLQIKINRKLKNIMPTKVFSSFILLIECLCLIYSC